MKRININTWDMSLEQFISHARCQNFKKYTQHTGNFSHSRQCGCDYYLYISTEELTIINPYTIKDKGKKYKSFFSSLSSDDCKTKAFNWIQELIKL